MVPVGQLARRRTGVVVDQDVGLGAGGQQRWVFQALQPGSAELTMSYGRAWEVERKGSWTLGLKVTVKP